MFKLTASELDRAKAAIEYHGYSTLLPKPPEWSDLVEHWHAAKDYLCTLNLEHYIPRQPLVITAAKDEKSVRLIHLLHPEDMLLYTALTLIVKNDIERIRLPRSQRRVYSYRASSESAKLYNSVHDTYYHYTERLKEKAEKKSTKAVATTDIADFYASIPHTQLRQLLNEAAQSRRGKKATKVLVSVFAAHLMAREGHGIPTGPLASRLLAEVVLNEIDKYLVTKRIDFVRWVDDYNIFSRSLKNARSVVFGLAAWLYKNYGLTLQSRKTHILTRSDYARRFLVDVEEKLSDRSAVLELLRQYGHRHEEEEIDELIDDLHAVELLEMLVDAITADGGVDFRIIGFAARRLRRIFLDRRTEKEVLEVLSENIQQLSPMISEVALLIIALLGKQKMPKRIGKTLLRSLRVSNVDHHAVWILTIFAERPRTAFLDLLIRVYQDTKSDVVRRYAILAVAKSGGRIRPDDGEWERAPPLVRTALLMSGSARHDNALNLESGLEQIIGGGLHPGGSK